MIAKVQHLVRVVYATSELDPFVAEVTTEYHGILVGPESRVVRGAVLWEQFEAAVVAYHASRERMTAQLADSSTADQPKQPEVINASKGPLTIYRGDMKATEPEVRRRADETSLSWYTTQEPQARAYCLGFFFVWWGLAGGTNTMQHALRPAALVPRGSPSTMARPR